MDGPTIIQSLIARGYNPVQAAALGGHILQESGGDPTNVNAKEGAHGLLQWRLDRWDNLQKFARDNGASPTDPNIQLDFIRHEMSGPERKAGNAFIAAGSDLPAASSALKQYIRFGDDSDAARLNNAKGLLGLPGMQNAGMLSMGAPASRAVAAPAAGTAATPAQPVAAATPADNGQAALMAQLANIPKMLQQQQQNQQYAPPAPVADNMAARLAAIAAAKQGVSA